MKKTNTSTVMSPFHRDFNTYWDSFPILLQFMSLHNAKRVVLDGKRVVDDPRDVVVKDPSQRRMKLGIDALDIVQIDGLVEEHLVEWRGEPAVNVVTVEYGNTDDAADEIEVTEMIFIHGRIWIDLERRETQYWSDLMTCLHNILYLQRVIVRVLEQPIRRIELKCHTRPLLPW